MEVETSRHVKRLAAIGDGHGCGRHGGCGLAVPRQQEQEMVARRPGHNEADQ